MPSRMAHPADLGTEYCWSDSPYYEEKSLAGASGPPLGWTFDQGTAVAPTQNPSSYHDFANLFGNGVFEDLPDMTWDQTTPETTNPTTPSSPSYCQLHTKYAPDLDTPFFPSEETQQYPTPRLLPKPHTPFAMSMQHRLRGHQLRRVEQQSQQLDLGHGMPYGHSSGPHLSPSLPTKRERSPNLDLDLTLGIEDDDGTPDPHFDETDGDVTAGSEPYAQLIYRALKSVPSHSMVLKDIYEWFEQNTDKPQTSTSAKGWQNSIRHNLSMNGAFNKVDQVPPPSEDSKKGFIWVLADSALEEGVKSTTRYRKHNSNKKSCKTDHPAPQRQISGAKGGKAAKKSAMVAGKVTGLKSKRSSRAGRAPSSYAKDCTTNPLPFSTVEGYERQVDERISMLRPPYQQDTMQCYLHAPSATRISPVPEPRLFQFSDIVGCANLGHAPLFYDDPVDVQEDSISSSQSLGSPDDIYIDYHFDGVMA